LKTLDISVLSKYKFNLIYYIKNNTNSIDYETYEANDWFIGSGAIESANKNILQELLKQAGMRFNGENAQYIVTLMAKAKSKLWESDVVKPILHHFGVSNSPCARHKYASTAYLVRRSRTGNHIRKVRDTQFAC